MKRRLLAQFLMLLFACSALGSRAAVAITPKGLEMLLPQEGRVRAPELEGARGWLNTSEPLSLRALRGKVVLLDFWTYGCINCIHIIPDLKRLEAKYPNQLVVIGVHSAKFDNEKETENIRRIILRYEIEHPVANDADFRIWRAYGVRAWPTQVLIDPAGYVIGAVSGEGNYELLEQTIAKTVEDFRRRGELKEEPLRLALEGARVGDLPLAFPGKVLADAARDRLFIADSNHNRIVVTRLDGALIDTIGTGAKGAADGAFDRAEFYRPQGMALDGEALYVADTENHLIRRVDLKTRMVDTIAGTGRQSNADAATGGSARNVSLNSPWDLARVGRTLYIAMAGPHQIWALDLEKMLVAPFAGTGREARTDGPVETSAFAQPSGLTSDGARLYVADSEANIIREIDLTKRVVATLAGGDLFDFGDEDGRGDDVRLQHPLGVHAYEGKVFITDTYNHKIKVLDPLTRAVKTFSGTGRFGQTDGRAPSFYEPGGLSIARNKLYIADTNNHAVRVVDLATRQTTTLNLRGLQPPATSEKAETDTGAPNATEITLAEQRLRAGTDGALVVDVALPEGFHLNDAAPQRYKITLEAGTASLAVAGEAELSASAKPKKLQLPLRLPLLAKAAGRASLRIQLTLYYCREDNTGTCRIKTLVWRAPVEIIADPEAPREIRAQAKVD